MRELVDAADLGEVVVVDSAGTARYHVGDPPDPRTMAEARRRGLASRHRARQLRAEEIESWDLLLAMDHNNVRDLVRLAGRSIPPSRLGPRVRLLRSFDPVAARAGNLEVSDPYYEAESSGRAAFAAVFDMVEAACRAVLVEIEQLVRSDDPEVRSA
jgi:protein-tyrosine phosphatase